MKVGDLVKLSSYGGKLKLNSKISPARDLGLIIERAHRDYYKVRWLNVRVPLWTAYHRRELKYATN